MPQVSTFIDRTRSDGRFKGRQDIFRAIEDISLSQNPPTWLFYGRRRTGKTSTLKHLPQRIGGDLIPLFVDCQKIATSTKLTNIAKIISDAIVTTALTNRNLKLTPIDPIALQDDPFYALQTWIDSISAQFPDKRFLLCLDEFERLQEIIKTTNSRAPLNFLRSLMQNSKQWILLFSGSHHLDELEPYWTDYLIGTRTLSLSYLNEPEARDLITHPIPTFPQIYDEAAITAIVHLTHRQPYLIQLVCSALIERLNQQKRDRITLDDVNAIVPIALERGSTYFKEFWDNLTPDQRDFLLPLSQNKPILPNPNLIHQLTQLEILNGTTFQVPLIQTFIQMKKIE